MPWIDVHYARRLTVPETDRLKSDFAEVMQAVLDKNESGLVVSFTESYALYRGGAPAHDAVLLDVRYIGQFPLEKKRELTRRLVAFLAASLSCDPQKITVLFSEMESQNWGRAAGEFS